VFSDTSFGCFKIFFTRVLEAEGKLFGGGAKYLFSKIRRSFAESTGTGIDSFKYFGQRPLRVKNMQSYIIATRRRNNCQYLDMYPPSSLLPMASLRYSPNFGQDVAYRSARYLRLLFVVPRQSPSHI
jgi:hypothetical protein